MAIMIIIIIIIIVHEETESHGQVVNIRDRYFRGPGFKLGRTLAIMTELFRRFPQSFQASAGIVP
jgi:hypothetical protein